MIFLRHFVVGKNNGGRAIFHCRSAAARSDFAWTIDADSSVVRCCNFCGTHAGIDPASPAVVGARDMRKLSRARKLRDITLDLRHRLQSRTRKKLLGTSAAWQMMRTAALELAFATKVVYRSPSTLRAWSHCGRFFDYDRSRSQRTRSQKPAARSHYIFCFSLKRTRCSCSLYLKVLYVPFCLLFSRRSPSPSRSLWVSLVFSVSLPLPLAITVSIRFAIALSLSLGQARCFSLALTRCFSLALTRCFSLSLARCFSLAVSPSLSLAVCHSLSLVVCHSLSLVVCHSLSLQLCVRLSLSLSLFLSLSLSLSLSHIHSRHTLWVQARCELTADHRVNDKWVLA